MKKKTYSSDKKYSSSGSGRGRQQSNFGTGQKEKQSARKRVRKAEPPREKHYHRKELEGKKSGKKESFHTKSFKNEEKTGLIRLNKYIANAGICSRREADELIAAGVISVNGVVVTQMGYKISPGDIVKFHEKPIRKERMVYVLLNKPKDFITTTEDPLERKTVMNLVEDACKERIYPVGRLDRATTGLLLLTNDGDLTKKLTHPSHRIKKIYHAELDKPLTRSDFSKIASGVELEDGIAYVDSIAFVDEAKDKTQVGIELHSGRNRIVRRIFESLDYKVKRLDRVGFAGLTKKDLPRGRWRFLTEKEVNLLKMLTTK